MTVGRCKYSWGSGGRCELTSRSRGKAPGSSEDISFYSTKNGPKIDAFLPPGIVVEIIRIGRQKISQKITFIFYTNEGVRSPYLVDLLATAPSISVLKLSRTSS